MKRALVALLVIVVIAVLGLFLIPRALYSAVAEQFIVAQAQKHGARLAFTEFEFGGATVQARAMEFFLPKALLMAQCAQAQLRSSPWQLLAGSLHGSFHCEPYGGTLNAAWKVGMNSRSGTVALSGSGIQLALHPQFAGLGFSGGELTLNEGEASLDGGIVNTYRGTLEIKKLSRPHPLLLTELFPQALPFSIPAFDELSLAGHVSGDPARISFKNTELNSDWGTASGMGWYEPRSKSLSLEANVRLSSKGSEFIGPLLPLFSQNKLSADSRDFTVQLQGKVPTPTVRFTPH